MKTDFYTIFTFIIQQSRVSTRWKYSFVGHQRDSVWQTHNTPLHHKHTMSNVKHCGGSSFWASSWSYTEMKVDVLEWPSQRPDHNSIENLWLDFLCREEWSKTAALGWVAWLRSIHTDSMLWSIYYKLIWRGYIIMRSLFVFNCPYIVEIIVQFDIRGIF